MSAGELHARREPTRSVFALWFGFLGGAVAWAVQLLAVYALAKWSCRVGMGGPHVVSALCLIVALLGWRQSVRDRKGPDGVAPDHFMGEVGYMSGAFFTLAIIAGWIAVFWLNPCPGGQG